MTIYIHIKSITSHRHSYSIEEKKPLDWYSQNYQYKRVIHNMRNDTYTNCAHSKLISRESLAKRSFSLFYNTTIISSYIQVDSPLDNRKIAHLGDNIFTWNGNNDPSS